MICKKCIHCDVCRYKVPAMYGCENFKEDETIKLQLDLAARIVETLPTLAQSIIDIVPTVVEEVIKNGNEKQIPKKPSETDKSRCIHCACVVKRDERFCKNCGQAILWESDTE